MSTTSSPFARVPRSYVALGTSLLVLSALFLFWPYQTGFFNIGRLTVLGGWWKWLNADKSGEWIFCPYVPLISLGLAWMRRHELAKIGFKGERLGLVIICAAAFSFWVGYKADIAYPGFAAFQTMIAGLIIWFAGWRWMRILLFPVLFLCFMWPIAPMEDQLANPMRRITASATSSVLTVIGVPNILEGTSLLSAGNPAEGTQNGDRFKLDVEQPCSGIRSLYSLLMLAALYGYIFLNGWQRRGLMVLSALPLAMLGNLVRMVMLALASMWFGSEFAIGKATPDGEMQISGFHELAGFIVFAIALAGIFALSSILEGLPWKRLGRRGRAAPAQNIPLTNEDTPITTWIRAGAVLGIAATLLLICAYLAGQPPLSPPGVRMQLPLSIGTTPGQDWPMTERERSALLGDVTLTRRAYFMPDGKSMLASLVLSGEARRELHRPDVCLPSQGWVIKEQQFVPVSFSDGRVFTANMMRVFKDTQDPSTGRIVRLRGINLYWFQGFNGVYSPDYYGHIARTYFDSVFKNINHRWAFVSFFTQMSDSQAGFYDSISEAAALEDLRSFISQIGPSVVKKPGEP